MLKHGAAFTSFAGLVQGAGMQGCAALRQPYKDTGLKFGGKSVTKVVDILETQDFYIRPTALQHSFVQTSSSFAMTLGF
jgi:hypothetical protein